jgi:hypothetical protein
LTIARSLATIAIELAVCKEVLIMEQVYHDFAPIAMPCSRNMVGARQMRDDTTVVIRLSDTEKIVGYGVIPISEYAERYIWRPNSRLRGR